MVHEGEFTDDLTRSNLPEDDLRLGGLVDHLEPPVFHEVHVTATRTTANQQVTRLQPHHMPRCHQALPGGSTESVEKRNLILRSWSVPQARASTRAGAC